MNRQDEFERCREAKRKKIRKKKFKRTVIFLTVVALIIGSVLCLTVFFPVVSVRSSGSNIYDEKQIIKASGTVGKNIFMLSEKRTEENIRSKLPFVDSVKIQKKLPDSITIKVSDAAEYAYYLSGGKFYSVSQKNYVLKEYTTEPESLLKINVSKVKCVPGKKIEINSSKEKEVTETLLSLFEEKNIQVNSIDVSNIVEIKIRVLDRFNVNIGTSAYLDKKINHLNGMINSISPERKGNIDLSMWSPKKSEGSFVEAE